MRWLTCVVFLFTILFAVSNSLAQQTSGSAVPNLIRFSGMLKHTDGQLLSSKIEGVTFAIYKQQDGGAPIWIETQNVTTDAAGNYSVLLGSTKAVGLPDDLFAENEQRWLGVQIQGQEEQPRVLLVSVPYAMKAKEAETLGGLPASAFVKAAPDATGRATTNAVTTVIASGAAGNAGGAAALGTPKPLSLTSGYIPFYNGTEFTDSLMFQSSVPYTIHDSGFFNLSSSAYSYQIGGSHVLRIGGAPTNHNLFLGVGAGQKDVGPPAVDNVFSGYNAGYSNTGGFSNVFSGVSAGYKNTKGSYNTFSGVSAGYSNTTGIFNTVSGFNAGYSNTQGSYNTFSGIHAGYYNTTGGQNTFFGAFAGESNTGSSNTFLGIYAGQSNTGSSNIYIGSDGPRVESNAIRIGTQGTGDGQQNAAFMAGIYGAATSVGSAVFVDSTGKLGTTGGTGGVVTSFNRRMGAVLPAKDDYSFPLISGTLGSLQLSGPYPGALTFKNDSNSFTGSFMGNGTGLTGVLPAGGSPNYIQNGTAPQAADFNISGNGSAKSINSATTYQIGGQPVLRVGEPFSFNLFLGLGAGANGFGNTFIGFGAGSKNSTGQLNTFVGSAAGSNNTTGIFDIYIGNPGPPAGTESNTIRIGAGQGTVYISGISDSFLLLGVPVELDVITGKLGISLLSPRFREQVRDMGNSTNALMKLRPVTFFYKPEYEKGDHIPQYGLLAEEVAEVYPELVAYDSDGKPYAVRYQYLTTMLLNEFQKQHAVVAAQREEIDSLRNELQLQRADFQQRLTSLEGLIGRASNAPPAESEQVQAHPSAGLR
jgi:hypothetical protein